MLRDLDDFLTFYDFPQEHWLHLRTTNPIESIFAGVRLRTNVTKRLPNANNAVCLVYKIVQRLAQHWRKVTGSNLCGLAPDWIGGRYWRGCASWMAGWLSAWPHSGDTLEGTPWPISTSFDRNSAFEIKVVGLQALGKGAQQYGHGEKWPRYLQKREPFGVVAGNGCRLAAESFGHGISALAG